MGYGFYDITLYYDSENRFANVEFTSRQNKVSGKYVHLMHKYKPLKTTRISVELKDEDDILFYHGSVLSAEAAFDKLAYWTLDPLYQDLMILNTIHRIALKCANSYSWDINVFEEAYINCLKDLKPH